MSGIPVRERVLIAGCGYVGVAVGCELASSGHRVWGLRRDVSALPSQIEAVSADLLVPGSLRDLPADLDVVYYLAAAGSYEESAYEAAYVTGLRNLLAALREQGQRPRRLLFSSSTSVYAQSAGEWVDERAAAEPERPTGQRLLEGEAIALGGTIPATIVRFSGIYGPSRTRLIDELRAGTSRRYSGQPRWTNRIHRDDCAGVLAHLMVIDPPHSIYIGTDSEPAAHNDVIAWLATELGVLLPSLCDPGPTGRSRGQNKRCRNARLLASGYQLRYPSYREGYGTLLGIS